MSVNISGGVLPHELAETVEVVFGTMMGIDARPSPSTWFPGGEWLTSGVSLAGGWNGDVLFQCEARVARQFASRFLSMEEPILAEDDVLDVLGELANMIGGNLKCVLNPGVRLSIPRVGRGRDYGAPPGTADTGRLTFDSPEGSFCVAVVTRGVGHRGESVPPS